MLPLSEFAEACGRFIRETAARQTPILVRAERWQANSYYWNRATSEPLLCLQLNAL